MQAELITIARSQLGTVESGGNNRGPHIREYQAATELTPAAWPWCAAFVDWCIAQWVQQEPVQRWLNLQNVTPEQWRPRTALAFGLIDWARARPRTVQILTDSRRPEPGDLVVFDFSHCGIVVAGHNLLMETIEGNTNHKGSRDSAAGDGVGLKRRPVSLARAFLRIQPSAPR